MKTSAKLTTFYVVQRFSVASSCSAVATVTKYSIWQTAAAAVVNFIVAKLFSEAKKRSLWHRGTAVRNQWQQRRCEVTFIFTSTELVAREQLAANQRWIDYAQVTSAFRAAATSCQSINPHGNNHCEVSIPILLYFPLFQISADHLKVLVVFVVDLSPKFQTYERIKLPFRI